MRVTDDRPCVVKWKGEEVEAIWHPYLSRTDMAKVELPDAGVVDMAWWNVKPVDTDERIDAVFGLEEEE